MDRDYNWVKYRCIDGSGIQWCKTGDVVEFDIFNNNIYHAQTYEKQSYIIRKSTMDNEWINMHFVSLAKWREIQIDEVLNF